MLTMIIDPPPHFLVRLATTSDEALLATLAARLADFDLPAWRTGAEIASADHGAMMRSIRASSSDDEVLIAERANVPVGCLHMLTTTDFFGRRHAHVSVLAITKDAEGSGVGRRLMAHAETWARQRGVSLLTLNVFDANARARRLYERLGFTPETIKYAKPL
jgi:ribosomal protein S18 acetylase RimI-like enzyme